MYQRSVQEVGSLREQLGLVNNSLLLDGQQYRCYSDSRFPFSTLTTVERHEYARRSHASEKAMRDRMMEAKTLVEEERVSKREFATGQSTPHQQTWHVNTLVSSPLVLMSLCLYIIYNYISMADFTRQYKTMEMQLESKIAYLEAQVRRLQHDLGKTDTLPCCSCHLYPLSLPSKMAPVSTSSRWPRRETGYWRRRKKRPLYSTRSYRRWRDPTRLSSRYSVLQCARRRELWNRIIIFWLILIGHSDSIC